jgi:uroporphyrinogen decarboxylase
VVKPLNHIVKKAFEHQTAAKIPKGELWLGTELFTKTGLEDNLPGHIKLVKRLGQDLMCLPIAESPSVNKVLGYSYFSPNDLHEATQLTDLFLIAIVDGPFQRMTEKHGLMKVLSGWMRERDNFLKQYKQEQSRVEHLLDQALKAQVDAVVIAEDLAAEKGPLINPAEIRKFFAPFYTGVVSKIHSGGLYALLHSCGQLTTLLPQFVESGFDGLAAIQHRTNNLAAIKEAYGAHLTIMAGIDGDLLEMAQTAPAAMKQFKKLLRALRPHGGFILSSCTGLYSGNFYKKIEELYGIANDLT